MTKPASSPFLSIQGIEKTYGSVTAVADVSLDIAKGEFVTFLGPSGSGKSTTLYAIAGFLEPTRGDVLLEGKSILRVPSNKRNIGMVFQRYTLFPHLSVAENVGFPLKVRRWSRADIDARVSAMLKLVRLEAMADRKPANLSGGQQQRVALARALAYDPPILLMDEPLSALDKQLREEIQTEIKRVHNETGVTILYVTHDQEEALRLSDRVALFKAGRIEQLGTGRDLYERPASRFVAGFIGHSNFLEGTVSRGENAVLLPDGTSLPGLDLSRVGGDQEKAQILIRPDHLSLHDGARTSARIAGTVTDLTYLGDHTRATVQTPWGATLSVRLPVQDPVAGLREGQTIDLGLQPSELRVY